MSKNWLHHFPKTWPRPTRTDTLWPTLESFLAVNQYPKTLSLALILDAVASAQKDLRETRQSFCINTQGELCLKPSLWVTTKAALERALTLMGKKKRKRLLQGNKTLATGSQKAS